MTFSSLVLNDAHLRWHRVYIDRDVYREWRKDYLSPFQFPRKIARRGWMCLHFETWFALPTFEIPKSKSRNETERTFFASHDWIKDYEGEYSLFLKRNRKVQRNSGPKEKVHTKEWKNACKYKPEKEKLFSCYRHIIFRGLILFCWFAKAKAGGRLAYVSMCCKKHKRRGEKGEKVPTL